MADNTLSLIQSSDQNAGGSLSLLRKTSSSTNNSKVTTQKPSTSIVKKVEASKDNPKGSQSKEKDNQAGSCTNTTTTQVQMQGQQQQQQQQTTTTSTKKAQKLRRRVATMAQRRAANIRERRRMLNLNSAFDRLRKKVPSFAYEKRLSRIETLKLAIMYIRFMDDLVRDDDYVEKYKRLTANYPPNGTISAPSAASSNPFMSPYLSSLYGHSAATSTNGGDSPQPTPLGISSPLLSPEPHHLLTRVRSQPTISGDNRRRCSSSATEIKPDPLDNCSPACMVDAAGVRPMPLHPCTGGGCSVGIATQSQPQHYSSASASLAGVPSVNGGGACCSSPASSSSTTTCSISSSSSSSSSTLSSSPSNSFNNSPDPSPNQVYHHQPFQHQHQQQQQPPHHRQPASGPSMDYYQHQQQQQHAYGNYTLEQTTPLSCFEIYGGNSAEHTATTTNQSGEQHASKMFYSYGLTPTPSASADHRQGHPAATQTMTGLGAGPTAQQHQQADGEYCASISSQLATMGGGQNALGYTLHSLQAR